MVSAIHPSPQKSGPVSLVCTHEPSPQERFRSFYSILEDAESRERVKHSDLLQL